MSLYKQGDRVSLSPQNELDRTNALIGRLVRLQGHEFPLPSSLEGREFESRSGYIFLSPKNNFKLNKTNYGMHQKTFINLPNSQELDCIQVDA